MKAVPVAVVKNLSNAVDKKACNQGRLFYRLSTANALDFNQLDVLARNEVC